MAEDYLVFTLTAALAAMGDMAGHERRGTLTWPGRSAVTGLVAAAMGIRRGDSAGFARLDALHQAVGVIDDGMHLRDYHTVETVPTAAARAPDSRPEAILRAGRGTNTTITLRDYRVGVTYVVALWGGPLDGLVTALERPTFNLYLGRKSCPLAAPPGPRIAQAEGPVQALEAAVRPPFGCSGPIRLIASDVPVGAGDAVDSRHDRPVDRALWHFGPRTVYLHYPAGQAGAGQGGAA